MQELQLTQWRLNTLLKKILKQPFTRDFQLVYSRLKIGTFSASSSSRQAAL
jgi:hypothetical protein